MSVRRYAVLVAMYNEDAPQSSIEGYANTAMCGNKLLFQLRHEAEMKREMTGSADVSSMTCILYAGAGKEAEASGHITSFLPRTAPLLCITKMDEEGSDLYPH